MTPLKNPWISATREPAAQSWEKPLRAFLRDIGRHPGLHGRFLNSISLLEHIGSRKILLSQQGASLNEDVLRHLAEEARHAHFFRKAAERFALRPLDYGEEDTLAPAAARMYFGRLDAVITRELGRERALAYPYVTLAVELRADWLYRLYEDALRAQGQTLTLHSVLAEEESHLREISDILRETDSLHEMRRRVFSALESALFENWFQAVERAAFPGRRQSELPL